MDYTHEELEAMLERSDQFTRWILGISAAVIVATGGALFSIVLALREDTAVIKAQLETMQKAVVELDVIQSRMEDHEYRILWIERDADNTRAQRAAARADSLRRPIRRANR